MVKGEIWYIDGTVERKEFLDFNAYGVYVDEKRLLIDHAFGEYIRPSAIRQGKKWEGVTKNESITAEGRTEESASV